MSTAPHTVDCLVPADHPAFAGHFPGQPLWPGVLVLAEALEVWRRLRPEAVGTPLTLAAAKFLAPVRPGERLQIELADDARGLRFEVRAGARVVARGQWQRAAAAPPHVTGATA